MLASYLSAVAYDDIFIIRLRNAHGIHKNC